MTISCEQCVRLISRQIDRATSNQETQAVRAHALECLNCRSIFRAMTGADSLLSKAFLSQGVTDGFSAMVVEKLAEAHMAETTGGPSRVLLGAAAGLGVLILAFLVSIFSASGPEIPTIGEVGRVEGGLRLAMFETNSFYRAGAGTVIPRGAKVKTSVGLGVLRLDGDRYVALAEESLVDLAHYHDGSKVILKQGGAYVSVPETDMQVDTPGAKVYGSKASFLVRYESSGKTIVVVKSGEVSLFNESGVVTLRSGQKSEVFEDKPPESPSKADVKTYLSWVRRLGL